MEAPRARHPQAVLFACGHNAVRSPMAESLLQEMFPQGVYVRSAGVKKGELDPFAVAVMAEFGQDISGHKPQTFEELEDWEGLNFDLIMEILHLGQSSIDYRARRGHAYMLQVQEATKRLTKPQSGSCLHCHASVYVPYKKAGDGDLIKGFEKMNQMPFMEARKLVEHPVACIDCHDPQTMQLRVTRPGFLEGIQLVKAAQGIENYDVNTMATRQEMRSFVCGQCHVEYYFKGTEKRLTYPWHMGLKADEILAYYDEVGFKDWVHAESGAPALRWRSGSPTTWCPW